MPEITVGGSPCPCKQTEYDAACLPNGTPVEWEAANPFGATQRGTGVLLFTTFYDGVVAHVDAGGKRVTIFLDFGGYVRRLADTTQLVGPGCQGEGI